MRVVDVEIIINAAAGTSISPGDLIGQSPPFGSAISRRQLAGGSSINRMTRRQNSMANDAINSCFALIVGGNRRPRSRGRVIAGGGGSPIDAPWRLAQLTRRSARRVSCGPEGAASNLNAVSSGRRVSASTDGSIVDSAAREAGIVIAISNGG